MNHKIYEYDIIIGNGAGDLATKVDKLISNGWIPHGNFIMNNSRKDLITFLQPVIRIKPTDYERKLAKEEREGLESYPREE